jgi:hypothetical protein
MKPLSNCHGTSESRQLDFIESIDTPDLPENDIEILEGDSFILLRNIETRSGFAKGGRCRAIQMRNRTVVVQFDDAVPKPFPRIPMEKASNGMKSVLGKLDING